jgi:lipid-binding SYLF domain-containing protein
MLITNERGASSLLHSKVKLGTDLSAAAGPVGRSAEANTDAYLRSEVLTYSRSRGLFAGVSLEGASFRPDNECDEALYGRRLNSNDIVLGPVPATPASAHKLIATLEKASPSLKKS